MRVQHQLNMRTGPDDVFDVVRAAALDWRTVELADKRRRDTDAEKVSACKPSGRTARHEGQKHGEGRPGQMTWPRVSSAKNQSISHATVLKLSLIRQTSLAKFLAQFRWTREPGKPGSGGTGRTGSAAPHLPTAAGATRSRPARCTDTAWAELWGAASSTAFHQRQVAGRAVLAGDSGKQQEGEDSSLPPPAPLPSAETAPAVMEAPSGGIHLTPRASTFQRGEARNPEVFALLRQKVWRLMSTRSGVARVCRYLAPHTW